MLTPSTYTLLPQSHIYKRNDNTEIEGTKLYFTNSTYIYLTLIIVSSVYFYILVISHLGNFNNNNTTNINKLQCVDITRPLPTWITARNQLSTIFDPEQFTTGAELGVQRGDFSAILTQKWTKLQKFYAVDLWKAQENYHDYANVGNDKQEQNYLQTLHALKHIDNNRLVVMRMYTSEAAKLISDNSLDFIYVDAQHTYCSVMEDLHFYWPKLKANGIIAGHDYLEASQIPGQDWSKCQNGDIRPGAVKGAVNEFFLERNLTVMSTKEDWPTWIVRKPQTVCY